MSAIQRRSDEKFCSACGTVIHNSATFCPQCGADHRPSLKNIKPLQQFRMSSACYCRHCGNEMHSSASNCPHCGGTNPSSTSYDTGEEKSRVVAAVLAFLAGGIGIHKFYCGSIGLGIIYLLFCWTFIPALIGFFEGIIYLCCKNDQEFMRRYCR